MSSLCWRTNSVRSYTHIRLVNLLVQVLVYEALKLLVYEALSY
jgi:hypothetical protein